MYLTGDEKDAERWGLKSWLGELGRETVPYTLNLQTYGKKKS